MATKRDENDYNYLDSILENLYESKKNVDSECPSAKDFVEYIDGKLSDDKMAAISRHLPFCDICHDLALAYMLPTEDSEEHPPAWKEFKDKLPRDIRPQSKGWWEKLVEWVRRWSPREWHIWAPAAALLAVVVIFSAGLGLYPSNRARLAYVEPYVIRQEVRSSERVEGDPLKMYYARGLDSLRKAQYWKLQRVNEAQLNEGIQNLEKAKQLAEEARNQNYMAQCYFYLGKAYLKKNDVAQARKQFEEIKKLSGSNSLLLERQREAEDLLNAMDRLDSSRK